MKSKEFDSGLPLLDFYDEYDLVENAYFTKTGIGDWKEEQIERVYELSQVKGVPKQQPQRVSFRFAAVLCQVMRSPEYAIEIIKARGMLADPSKTDIELALRRLERARNWISEQAPEYLRFNIVETLPAETKRALTAGQKQGLGVLAASLAARDFAPIELHNHVYEIAEKVGIKPSELFEAIYLVLIGRKSGPRVGNFISALDKEFVIRRLGEV